MLHWAVNQFAVATLVAITAFFQPAATATPIQADGVFHEFRAVDPGGPAGICDYNTCAILTSTINPGADTGTVPPWTFSGAGSLFVLDLFLSGDQFEVFDNGVSLGATSAPGGFIQCGTPSIADIGCSIGDPDFSRGTYSLGDGNHAITINYIVATYVGHTGAALQLNPAPEPATWFLLPLGTGLLTWAGTRRSRNMPWHPTIRK